MKAKSKLDPRAFVSMMENVRRKHPQVKVVATTLREVHSTNRHRWGAVAWINGRAHVAPVCDLDVLDRVGGGDGFAAGLFYGLLAGVSPEEVSETGLGSWSAAHHVSRRHYHGNTGSGARVRQGRLARIQR